jgi:hypothetical protein
MLGGSSQCACCSYAAAVGVIVLACIHLEVDNPPGASGLAVAANAAALGAPAAALPASCSGTKAHAASDLASALALALALALAVKVPAVRCWPGERVGGPAAIVGRAESAAAS